MISQTIENDLIKNLSSLTLFSKTKINVNAKEHQDITELKESIANLGILNPIMLYKNNDKTFIIDGIKRIHIAKELHHEKIPVIKLNKHQLYDAALLFLVHTPPLSFTQKAIFLSELVGFGMSLEHIQKNIASKLNLPPNQSDINALIKISELPDSIIQFSHEKSLSFKQLFILNRYPKPVIELVDYWNQLCMFSVNQFLLVTDYIHDIYQETPSTFHTLKNQKSIRAILKNSASHKQRNRALISYIHTLKNPIISEKNQQFHTIIKKSDPPSLCHINWDQSLEKKEIHIHANLSKKNDLQLLRQYLNSTVAQTSLNTLLLEL